MSLTHDLAERGLTVSSVSAAHLIVSSGTESVHVLIPVIEKKPSRNDGNDVNSTYSALLRNRKNVIVLDNDSDVECVVRALTRHEIPSVHEISRTDNKKVAAELGISYRRISQSYEIVFRNGASYRFAVCRRTGAPVTEISGIPSGVPVEAVDALVSTLMRNGTRCVLLKSSGSFPLAASASSWHIVPTRRRVTSQWSDGAFRLRPIAVSTGLVGDDDDFCVLAPSHKENMMAVMFPTADIFELRRRASEHHVRFLDWPEELSEVSCGEVSRARNEFVLMDKVADALGVGRDVAESACSFYGIPLPDGGRSLLTKNQMSQYRQQTGYGSPAARPDVREKIGRTNSQRYGSENVFGNKEIQFRIRQTNMSRHGSENVMRIPEFREAARRTMLERYGFPTTMESPILSEKVRRTMVERYGVENAGQCHASREKTMRTNMERYGTSYSGHTDQSDEKRHATNQLRYGVDEVMQSPEIRERACRALWKLFGSKGLSSYERQVKSVLDRCGLVVGQDYRVNDYLTLGSLQLDFVIPSRSLAIEVSPTWTHHSNISTPDDAFIRPKPFSYHKKKYELSKDKGLELITLFDWMLEEPMWSDITEDFLTFRIVGTAPRVFYGRDVVIVPADSKNFRKECIDFCRTFHFQGVTASASWFAVQVRRTGEMVGVFSVSPSRSDGSALDLKRVCWRSGVQVRYGLSKIVKFLERKYSGDYRRLVSFSDNNIGSGSSYEKAGFTFVRETGPSLVFVNTRHPQDRYSWSVATPWSARSGVIASALGSMIVSNTEARRIVETRLPHRRDSGVGYSSLYDTGNKLWRKDFNND